MKHAVLAFVLLPCIVQTGWTQGDTKKQSTVEVRQSIREYVELFNKHDAAAVAARWTTDAVSVDLKTGQRTVGREALQKDFERVFKENPGVRLAGRIDYLRMIRPDVALAEGEATLLLPDAEPTRSDFTAVLVKEGGQWLISSSDEGEVPTPPSAYDALKKLEWLVGSWHDQTEGAQVNTTVRWSAKQSFLIRSFKAQFEDGDVVEGTQVIGWDPQNKEIRTWTFNSDGSFGEGTMSKNGDEWMIKMTHVTSDGSLAAATQVLTRIDDNTLQIRKIGETVDGEPVPAAEPVTVVRVKGAADSTPQKPAVPGAKR